MKSHGGMILTEKTEDLGEKLVTVPLRTSQIPHRLSRDRTRACEVAGRRITA
jgi:hypothetical protein